MHSDEDKLGTAPGWRLRWPWWIPYLAILLGILLLVGLIGQRFKDISYFVWPIFLPLLASVALAYILDPVVLFLERRGLRRANAILCTLLGIIALLVVGILFVLPRVAAQLALTSQRLPTVLAGLVNALDPYFQELRAMNEELYQRVHGQVQAVLANPNALAGQIVDYLMTGSGGVVGFTTGLFDAILIPFFVYYILLDLPRLRQDVESLIPPRFRTNVHEVFDRIAAVGSNFIRGQIVVSAWMSGMYAISYLLLGVPLAIVLGVFSGFANLIPYVGPVIAAVVVCVLTAVDSPEWWRVAGILGVSVLIQTIEALYLTPRILGDRLSLHPFLVLAGITVGGHLFGILGMVLATPTIAVFRVLVSYVHHAYLHSTFYQGAVTPLSVLTAELGEPSGDPPDAYAEVSQHAGDDISPVTGKPAA